MAATDHLGPQWFHGTAAEFRPGDTLSPEGANDYGRHEEESGRGWVYAAPSPGRAMTYAIGRAEKSGGTPRVYQVRPSGKMHPDPHDEYPSGRTRGRMHVIREVPEHEIDWDDA